MSFRTVLCLSLAIFAHLFSRAADGVVWIDTDFAKSTKPVAKNERIEGVLPEGWIEHSAWAKAWVKYERVDQDNAAFLRVNVSRIDDGRCQFAHPVPAIEEESYFELSLTVRSRQRTPARFGLREAAAPFRFLWEQQRVFGTEWQDLTQTFRVMENTGTIALYFQLEAPGELDLLRVKLLRRSRDQYVAHLRDTAGDEPPVNLMAVTRFPLGLQSGWSLAREISDGDGVEIETDEKLVGPSSAPALRISDRINSLPGPLATLESLERQIDSANPLSGLAIGDEKDRSRRDVTWQLTSPPIPLKRQFENHSASLYFCGEGRVTVHVLADGKSLTWRAIELKDNNKWRRLEIPFKPALLAKAHSLRLDGVGRVWIDALRVEAGQVREYAPAGSCEVALATESPLRIFFENETPEFQYAVTGYAEGSLLKLRAINVYGESKDLPDVSLPGGFLNKGSASLNGIFTDRPLGSFRIEAWVENLQKERISSINEMVVHRVRSPRFLKTDAPDSPFGIHTLATTRHLRMAKAIGINWVRLHDAGSDAFAWSQLEYEKGKWAFQDRTLERYRANNLMILGVLETTPDWASTLERRRHPYYDRYYEPKDFDDFATYCRMVARRYKNAVHHFEVWNQPFLPAYWHVRYDPKWRENFGYISHENPAARYVELLKAASTAVKSMQPDATVVGYSTAPGPLGERWTRELLAAGAQDHCSVASYHHYTTSVAGGENDAVSSGWKQAVGALAEKSPAQRVWLTEGSPLSGLMGSGMYKHTMTSNETEDLFFAADRLSRYIVSVLAQKTEKLFLYGMHPHGRYGVRDDFRLLVAEDGSLHPSGAAFANVAWHLEGLRFSESLNGPQGVRIHLFASASRCVAALVPPPQGSELKLKPDAAVVLSDVYGNAPKPGEALNGTILFAHVQSGGAEGLSKLKALLP